MIRTLPISSLSDDDLSIFGRELVDLARLKRAGLPVCKEIITDSDGQVYLTVKNEGLRIIAYFDPNLGDTILENNSSQPLPPQQSHQIDQLVIQANKKLYLPRVYTFLVRKDVQIIGLQPYTHPLKVSPKTHQIVPRMERGDSQSSAIKVFFELGESLVIPQGIDGAVVNFDSNKEFDSTVLKLLETSLAIPSKPVIFQLPNGPLGKRTLDSYSQIILFVRHKKASLNVEAGLPVLKSTEELLQLKRELSCREVVRKGSWKFWMKFSTPENILNVENYLSAGIDGIILDLDLLQSLLLGVNKTEGVIYPNGPQVVIDFIGSFLRTTHKVRVPVLILGRSALHPEVLDFLVEKGIFGVVGANPLEVESLPEHLRFSERRMLAKKSVAQL